jgi:plasmid replication initiation protein
MEIIDLDFPCVKMHLNGGIFTLPFSPIGGCMKLVVTKSNSLIEASYHLSLQAQRLVLACLAKLDSRSEVPKEMTLCASEYAEITGMDIKNAHRELYKAADGLFDAVIILLRPDDNEETKLRWVQKQVKTLNGEGSVKLIWSDDILDYISQLKGKFTSYNLHHAARLNSAYSIRLYELLMQFKSTGERHICIDELKKILCIADKYRQFKDLNKWVIKAAVDDINSFGALSVSYEVVKAGRTAHSINFSFEKN